MHTVHYRMGKAGNYVLEEFFLTEESLYMASTVVDWAAIDRDPRFRALHKKKTTFLWSLMFISIAYYFLLPIGAAYYPDLFKTKVWGPVNFGLLFALSEFVVAWSVAAIYARRANREFDQMSSEIVRDLT